MSELSGTAAVGIETVEWLDAGGGNLTVRVTGRWRRRRPASSGQVMLVLESEGRRHRFPAMPEPPSLGGAGPGMWQLSFSVPGWLAPALGGHAYLVLGTVTVPLPALGIGEGQPPGPTRPGGAPLPSATEEEAPPALSVQELERQLADVRSDRQALTVSLAEGERTRRIAEQRAHAEQALRRDLARQLSEREREADRAREAMGELAAAEERLRTLERELGDARRRGDEAEQLAAAAAARTRARHTAPPPATPGDLTRRSEAARLRVEQRLRAQQATIAPRVPAEPRAPVAAAPAPEPPAPAPTMALAPPTVLESPASVTTGLVDTLRRELDARAGADAALRMRLVTAETRLAARVLLERRTTETLAALRAELDGLRGALQEERARRQVAERLAAELDRERRDRALAERRVARLERDLGGQRERSRDAHDAIAELRGALEQLQRPDPDRGPEPEPSALPAEAPPTGSEAVAGGLVQPGRLTDALARLRESVEPPEAPTPVALTLPGPSGRTLQGPFRRLVKVDADAAGELLLDLLALQRVGYPHPIAYDLVLGPGRGCVRVTVGGEGPPSVELHGAARTREEVDFRVTGPPGRIARLLCAHGIWRRLGPRVARVRGRRDGLAALQALLGLPLDLAGLSRAGAQLRPRSVLALAAGMVAPAWTAGERFVIAHRDPEGQSVFLAARDGRSLEVLGTAPAGRIATTITGSGPALVRTLTGAGESDAEVIGDEGPLASLRTWIAQAQNA